MTSMSGAGTAPDELLRQIAAFPERVKNKIIELYYPLTEEALRAQNQAKRRGIGGFFTNLGYVFNALRLENVFGDRPMLLSVREFARKWGIPLSSCYAAFATLRKLGIIDRKGGLSSFVWGDPTASSPPLEPPSPDIPVSPQESTLLPQEEVISVQEEVISVQEEVISVQEEVTSVQEEVTSVQEEVTSVREEVTSVREEVTSVQEENPPTPEDSSAKVAALAKKSKPKTKSKPTPSVLLNFSSELMAQLKEVKVDTSRKDILKVLERATPAQISEVIDHMHQHWELIETNYSHGHTTIFLKELNKRLEGGTSESKPKSKKKKTHSQEFLDWYTKAIAEGIVIDRPAEHLPTSSSNEPIVTLANGEPSVWTLVKHPVSNQTTEPSSEENPANLRETLAKLNLLHKFKPQRNTE